MKTPAPWATVQARDSNKDYGASTSSLTWSARWVSLFAAGFFLSQAVSTLLCCPSSSKRELLSVSWKDLLGLGVCVPSYIHTDVAHGKGHIQTGWPFIGASAERIYSVMLLPEGDLAPQHPRNSVSALHPRTRNKHQRVTQRSKTRKQCNSPKRVTVTLLANKDHKRRKHARTRGSKEPAEMDDRTKRKKKQGLARGYVKERRDDKVLQKQDAPDRSTNSPKIHSSPPLHSDISHDRLPVTISLRTSVGAPVLVKQPDVAASGLFAAEENIHHAPASKRWIHQQRSKWHTPDQEQEQTVPPVPEFIIQEVNLQDDAEPSVQGYTVSADTTGMREEAPLSIPLTSSPFIPSSTTYAGPLYFYCPVSRRPPCTELAYERPAPLDASITSRFSPSLETIHVACLHPSPAVSESPSDTAILRLPYTAPLDPSHWTVLGSDGSTCGENCYTIAVNPVYDSSLSQSVPVSATDSPSAPLYLLSQDCADNACLAPVDRQGPTPVDQYYQHPRYPVWLTCTTSDNISCMLRAILRSVIRTKTPPSARAGDDGTSAGFACHPEHCQRHAEVVTPRKTSLTRPLGAEIAPEAVCPCLCGTSDKRSTGQGVSIISAEKHNGINAPTRKTVTSRDYKATRISHPNHLARTPCGIGDIVENAGTLGTAVEGLGSQEKRGNGAYEEVASSTVYQGSNEEDREKFLPQADNTIPDETAVPQIKDLLSREEPDEGVHEVLGTSTVYPTSNDAGGGRFLPQGDNTRTDEPAIPQIEDLLSREEPDKGAHEGFATNTMPQDSNAKITEEFVSQGYNDVGDETSVPQIEDLLSHDEPDKEAHEVLGTSPVSKSSNEAGGGRFLPQGDNTRPDEPAIPQIEDLLSREEPDKGAHEGFATNTMPQDSNAKTTEEFVSQGYNDVGDETSVPQIEDLLFHEEPDKEAHEVLGTSPVNKSSNEAGGGRFLPQGDNTRPDETAVPQIEDLLSREEPDKGAHEGFATNTMPQDSNAKTTEEFVSQGYNDVGGETSVPQREDLLSREEADKGAHEGFATNTMPQDSNAKTTEEFVSQGYNDVEGETSALQIEDLLSREEPDKGAHEVLGTSPVNKSSNEAGGGRFLPQGDNTRPDETAVPRIEDLLSREEPDKGAHEVLGTSTVYPTSNDAGGGRFLPQGDNTRPDEPAIPQIENLISREEADKGAHEGFATTTMPQDSNAKITEEFVSQGYNAVGGETSVSQFDHVLPRDGQDNGVREGLENVRRNLVLTDIEGEFEQGGGTTTLADTKIPELVRLQHSARGESVEHPGLRQASEGLQLQSEGETNGVQKRPSLDEKVVQPKPEENAEPVLSYGAGANSQHTNNGKSGTRPVMPPPDIIRRLWRNHGEEGSGKWVGLHTAADEDVPASESSASPKHTKEAEFPGQVDTRTYPVYLRTRMSAKPDISTNDAYEEAEGSSASENGSQNNQRQNEDQSLAYNGEQHEETNGDNTANVADWLTSIKSALLEAADLFVGNRQKHPDI